MFLFYFNIFLNIPFLLFFLFIFNDNNRPIYRQKKMDKQSIRIGIDLGTTNSCVATYSTLTKQPMVHKNRKGSTTTPSIVGFNENNPNKPLIGTGAKFVKNPSNKIHIIKRLIGREHNEVKGLIKDFPYTVVESNSKPMVKVTLNEKDEFYAPEEISAMILEEMISLAAQDTNKRITGAVITVLIQQQS